MGRIARMSGRRSQGLLVAQSLVCQTGSHVGDQRQGQHLHPRMASDDRLGHGAHAHGIGTQDFEHADFGGRLELRAHDPGVDPLVHLHARLCRGPQRFASQLRVIGSGHVDEPPAALHVLQRRALHHVDVVAQGHQAAGGQPLAQAAGGIGQHHGRAAHRSRRLKRPAHRRRIAMLIGVFAAHEQHRAGEPLPFTTPVCGLGPAGLRRAGQAHQAHPRLVAGYAQGRKGRQLRIGNILGQRRSLDHAGPARAQNHGQARPEVTPHRAQAVRAGLNLGRPRWRRRHCVHFPAPPPRCPGPKLWGSRASNVVRSRTSRRSATTTGVSDAANSRSFCRQPPQGVTGSLA